MQRIPILHISPAHAGYGNRVWIQKDKWFNQLTNDERDLITKQVMWGGFDQQCAAEDTLLHKSYGELISFEVTDGCLPELVTLLTCGVRFIVSNKG